MKIDDHLIEDPVNFKVYSTNAVLAGGVPKVRLDAYQLEARVSQLPYDPRILQAFVAKETNPAHRRMTNKELATSFGVDQTEMERAIQQIKIDLGSGKESTIRSEDRGANLSVSISKSVQTSPSISARTVETAKAFGLGIDSSQQFNIFENLQLEIRPGDVIYVTGESGSGKSMLLKELQPILKRKFGKTVCEGNPSLQTTQVSNDEIVIDNIGSDFDDAMRILSASGLSEAFIMMRKYSELSDGQKYRYRIAKTMNDKEAKVWIFDEFVATLDRDSAKAVAYTLQGAARKMGKILIVATTHEDLLDDLNPTLFIKKLFGAEVRVERI
jgi:ABC-type lipoprotein export system ATPase subunit